jgi:hypothetical protein
MLPGDGIDNDKDGEIDEDDCCKYIPVRKNVIMLTTFENYKQKCFIYYML